MQGEGGEREAVRFLIDESVTAAVVRHLRDAGFDVHESREILGEGAPDKDVAKLGDELRAIVVNSNHKHFVRQIPRRPPDNNLRLRFAGRLSFTCPAPREVKRLAQLMHYIQYEVEYCAAAGDKRFIATIHAEWLQIDR